MDPTDSIEGLGMVYADLSESGKVKAIFRLAKSFSLSDSEREEIAKHLDSAKGMTAKTRDVLRAIVAGTPPTTT